MPTRHTHINQQHSGGNMKNRGKNKRWGHFRKPALVFLLVFLFVSFTALTITALADTPALNSDSSEDVPANTTALENDSTQDEAIEPVSSSSDLAEPPPNNAPASTENAGFDADPEDPPSSSPSSSREEPSNDSSGSSRAESTSGSPNIPEEEPGSSSIDESEDDSSSSLSEEDDSEDNSPRGFPAGVYKEGDYINPEGTVRYYCWDNGEAAIMQTANLSGHFTVPATIDAYDKTYKVVAIYQYDAGSGRMRGAFQGQGITGLSFESGSELRYICESAFSACYGLGGKTIVLPDTVTYVGAEAFAMFENVYGGIARLVHPRLAEVTGHLPNLVADTKLPVPDEAATYESIVDSTRQNTLLHKAASWTDTNLTEAEIRIDFGKSPNYNAAMDIIIVLDYSGSMLNSTDFIGKGGLAYTYPRSFLTDDVVSGIADIILNSSDKGYNNRLGLVAFGGASNELWHADFMTSSADVEQALFDHPLTLTNHTNYNAGLQGAIEMINRRQDTSRKPIIIFLSDGTPFNGTPGQENRVDGYYQAQTLRSMKAKVFPISIFIDPTDYMTQISHNGSTAYDASDPADFERVFLQVLEDAISEPNPLDTILEDVLGDDFELLSGTPSSDVTISKDGGTVTLTDGKLRWDLTGCASDTVHTIKIKVKVKAGTELTASGILPTNTFLGATDGSITTSTQPQLGRYLVSHAFENGAGPDIPLPQEVIDLLPSVKGGYREGETVSPTDPSVSALILNNGDVWEFLGWDSISETIDAADVLFTGYWRIKPLEISFTKIDMYGVGIPGVEFELYFWQGSTPPGSDDRIVSRDVSTGNVENGKWRKINTAPILSGADGKVQFIFPHPGLFQLVESKTAPGFAKPQVQWQFTISQRNTLYAVETIPKHEDVYVIDHFINTPKDGADNWTLTNHKQRELVIYKVSMPHPSNGQTVPEGLDGAILDLYFWTGPGEPTDTDFVTYDTVVQGLWVLVDTVITENGGEARFVIPTDDGWFYQMMEWESPVNFNLPTGQWRISFTADGEIDYSAIKSIPGDAGVMPPLLEVQADGPFKDKLALTNAPIYTLPMMGGHGKWPIILTGMVFLASGFTLMFMLWARQQPQPVITGKLKDSHHEFYAAGPPWRGKRSRTRPKALHTGAQQARKTVYHRQDDP